MDIAWEMEKDKLLEKIFIIGWNIFMISITSEEKCPLIYTSNQ